MCQVRAVRVAIDYKYERQREVICKGCDAQLYTCIGVFKNSKMCNIQY